MKLAYWMLRVWGGLLLGAASAHSGTLVFLEQSPNGVAWKWFSPMAETVSTAYIFDVKPAAFYWEKNEALIRVLTGNRILAFDRKGRLASDLPHIIIPRLLENETPIGLWRDTSTKRLRIAVRYPVPPTGISGTVDQPVLHDAAGKAVEALTAPEWGVHEILKVIEFSPVRKTWEIVAIVPTKSQSGDTPGLSVLKPFWSEDGTSDKQLTSSKFCAGFGQLYNGRKCYLEGDQATLKADFLAQTFPQCKLSLEGFVLGEQCPINEIGRLSCKGCLFSLLHSSIQGDRLHAALPVRLVNIATGQLGRIRQLRGGSVEQIMMDQQDGYMFIEKLRPPYNLYVLDINSGDIILTSRGRGAMWVEE